MSSDKNFFQQDRGGIHSIRMNPVQYDPKTDKKNPWFGRHNETVYRKNSGPVVPTDFEFDLITLIANLSSFNLVGAVENVDYDKYGLNLGICDMTISGNVYHVLYI